MDKKTVRDIDVNKKRVLVRVDFNVPLDAEQQITDDTRIAAALPTINYLLEHGATVILVSHLGRPDGQVVEKLRMAPIARRLGELLHRPIETAGESVGPEVTAKAQALQPGQVLLLEICAFTKKKRKTTLPSQNSSPHWENCTLTMPSVPLTVPTPQQKG